MEFAVGGADMAEYLPLLEEELAYRGEDRRAPAGTKADVAPDVDFHVADHRRRACRACSPRTGCSRRASPSSSSRRTTTSAAPGSRTAIPGCRVDNPNHNYSYSFAQRHDWPFHFSTQDVLLDYFQRCADAFGLRDHIRFGTEVRVGDVVGRRPRWTVRVRDADGARGDARGRRGDQRRRSAQPAVAPRHPRAATRSPAVRSTRRAGTTTSICAGKRVAVIGTGASAVQFIPEIAPIVGELLVFQRTPPWIGADARLPRRGRRPVCAGSTRHVPSYSEWNRFCIFWQMGDGALASVRVDPDVGRPKGAAVSAMNDFMRHDAHGVPQRRVRRPARPRSRRCMPHYPPGAEAACSATTASGPATLKRDNVRLVTDADRARSPPTGIVTADGAEHEVDVIIYGTGFKASKFLTPMKVTGRDGVDLHEQWDGDARAYLGVTVPGFPNLFCLYGPNTNIVVNGSIVYFSECGVRYILGLLELLLGGGHARARRPQGRARRVQRAGRRGEPRMAWGWSDVNSWYKNEHGRVAQNWPFTLLEYWQRTRGPIPPTSTCSADGGPACNPDRRPKRSCATSPRCSTRCWFPRCPDRRSTRRGGGEPDRHRSP